MAHVRGVRLSHGCHLNHQNIHSNVTNTNARKHRYDFLGKPVEAGVPVEAGCCYNFQVGVCRSLCCILCCCRDKSGAGCMKSWCGCCMPKQSDFLSWGDENRRKHEENDPIHKPHVSFLTGVKSWEDYPISCFSCSEPYGKVETYRSVLPASANMFAMSHASNMRSSFMSASSSSPFTVTAAHDGIPSQLIPKIDPNKPIPLSSPFGRMFLALLSTMPMHSLNYLLLQQSCTYLFSVHSTTNIKLTITHRECVQESEISNSADCELCTFVHAMLWFRNDRLFQRNRWYRANS